MPVDPFRIELALRRSWRTPNGWTNAFRLRSLAVIAVALAVPKGMSMVRLCSMRPHELLMLNLRMPRFAWRRALAWLHLRAGMLDPIQAMNLPWLAMPPLTNGRPRMVGWGMQQTLHRSGAPAWRARELLRASWSPDCAVVTYREVARRRMRA